MRGTRRSGHARLHFAHQSDVDRLPAAAPRWIRRSGALSAAVGLPDARCKRGIFRLGEASSGCLLDLLEW